MQYMTMNESEQPLALESQITCQRNGWKQAQAVYSHQKRKPQLEICVFGNAHGIILSIFLKMEEALLVNIAFQKFFKGINRSKINQKEKCPFTKTISWLRWLRSF